MTRLVYRGNTYYKESLEEMTRQDWNHRHRSSLWLRYRGRRYRPVQVGGLILRAVDKRQTSESV